MTYSLHSVRAHVRDRHHVQVQALVTDQVVRSCCLLLPVCGFSSQDADRASVYLIVRTHVHGGRCSTTGVALRRSDTFRGDLSELQLMSQRQVMHITTDGET